MARFSKLMLGTAQFGMNYGAANISGKPSFDTVKTILKHAYDGGVTALDTAPEYGDSEEVIGRALKELGLSDRFRIVSKIPAIPDGAEPETFMEQSILKSLKRLQMDSLAAILLHVEKDSIHLDALKQLKAKGLAENAGISLNTLAHADDGADADCLQVPASLLDHRFDRCFGQGSRHCFVRGAYLQGMLLMPEEKVFIPEVLERRKQLEKLGIPMAELALRYLFAKADPKSVLTGVETLAQLRENLRIAQLPPLESGNVAAIERIMQSPLPEICVSPYFWPQYKKEHGIFRLEVVRTDPSKHGQIR